MYDIGELIVYGSTGVCAVEDIEERREPGGGGRRCYILRPLYETFTVTVPVDSTKVFMRPIITREEAERLIDLIPQIKAQAYHSRVLRELAEHYEQSIKSHDCAELIELTMSLYAKKQDVERQKKKFGAIDERFMRRGEELLFGELSAALDIPRDSIQDYIAARVGAVSDPT